MPIMKDCMAVFHPGCSSRKAVISSHNMTITFAEILLCGLLSFFCDVDIQGIDLRVSSLCLRFGSISICSLKSARQGCCEGL